MGDDDTTEIFPKPLYSPGEATFLAILPYFTAPFSVIGSSLIMWSIWFDRKTQLKIAYHRIMLGISFIDFIASSGMIILGPWVIPSDYEYGRSGRGNYQTCEASAFLLNMTFGAMWYSMFLAVYFVMIVCWEWKERTIACCWEPLGHVVCFIFPLTEGIRSSMRDLFNPLYHLPGWCWFSDYPPFCSDEDRSVACIRGKDYRGYRTGIGAVVFIWIVIVLCMVAMVLKVRRMERTIAQYSVGDPSYQRTRETTQQGLLYIGAFVASYLFLLAVTVLLDKTSEDPNVHKGAIFFLAILAKILTPLQGLFNSFVYFRKRFHDLIKEGKSLAFLRQLPWLGPWIVTLSERRRQRRRVRHGGESSGVPEHPLPQDCPTTKTTTAGTTLASMAPVTNEADADDAEHHEERDSTEPDNCLEKVSVENECGLNSGVLLPGLDEELSENTTFTVT